MECDGGLAKREGWSLIMDHGIGKAACDVCHEMKYIFELLNAEMYSLEARSPYLPGSVSSPCFALTVIGPMAYPTAEKPLDRSRRSTHLTQPSCRWLAGQISDQRS